MVLRHLKETQSALISGFNEKMDPQHSKRLHELGFEPGQEVVCVRKTPFGGPLVFKIADCLFSIEHSLADQVLVELKE